jgi:Xaa-Pro aminopeptidase
MLTHFRYTVAPAYINQLKAVKNDTEIDGMRRAYLRDGAAFVSIPDQISEVHLIMYLGQIPGLVGGKA